MNRPQGVTVLGWVAIVFGAIGLVFSVFGLIASLGLMAVGAGVAGVGEVAGGASIAGSAFILVAILGVTALLCLVELAFGVGALQLKPWAWSLGMIWSWVSIAMNVVTLVANGGKGITSSVIGIVVALAILYYLYTDDVRAAFNKTAQTPPSFMVPVFEQIDKLVAGNKARPQAPAPPPVA